MTREYISTTPISERSDRVQHKIYHHLDRFKRGKLTLWLKNRMVWDEEVRNAMTDIVMPAPRPPALNLQGLNKLTLLYYNKAIVEQFNKQALFYKYYTGTK